MADTRDSKPLAREGVQVQVLAGGPLDKPGWVVYTTYIPTIERKQMTETHGYLLAIEMTEELNPAALKRMLESVVPQLSKQIVRAELEHLGKIDLYDDEGRKID